MISKSKNLKLRKQQYKDSDMKFGDFNNTDNEDVNEMEGYDLLIEDCIEDLEDAYLNGEKVDSIVEKIVKIKRTKLAIRKHGGKRFKFTSDKEGFKAVLKPEADGTKPGDFKEVKMTAGEQKELQRSALKRSKKVSFKKKVAKGKAKSKRLEGSV